MTPEGRVKARVKRLLKKHNCYFFMPVQMGYGAPTLDFLVCHRGKFIGIETKATSKQDMTKRQAVVAEEMRDAGAQVFLVNDTDSLLHLAAALEEAEDG